MNTRANNTPAPANIGESEVIAAVKAAVQQLYGLRLAKLILYGSRARGDQREDSDYDFLVVLNDEEVKTGAELRHMNSAMYDLEQEFNTSISTLPTSVFQYLHSDYTFYQNVRREGIEL
ncbi:MAG: nucleotidyltransferase domain-containing protein [Saprospiraceae bacterium]|nr:nucleotidyltransferase domain-containing protein [Saprospiraceae bacterium]